MGRGDVCCDWQALATMCCQLQSAVQPSNGCTYYAPPDCGQSTHLFQHRHVQHMRPTGSPSLHICQPCATCQVVTSLAPGKDGVTNAGKGEVIGAM